MVTATRVRVRSNPSTYFRKDPYYYFWYDGIWMVFVLACIGVMYVAGWTGLEMEWSGATLLWLIPACYAQMLCHVFVHNCCHVNFPRPINRWVGELCGAVILTRYASWEILHARHHRYSDDTVKDPHPASPGFFKFLMTTMLFNLERTLHDEYYDRHGDTPQNRRLEQYRSYLSYLSMAALAFAWHQLLGPAAFWLVFAPSAIVGITFIGHFNWRTHNGQDPAGDYGPINIDSGIYWIGNRLFFGIYMHDNHHKRANLFNPMHYDAVMAKKRGGNSASD